MGVQLPPWRLRQALLFDVGALPYAFLTSQPTWRLHGGELAELAGAASGDRLLDLGSGPGESAFGMAERVPGLRVTGLDFSDTMVAIARARSERRARRLGSMVVAPEFTRGDAMDMPFADASWDAVTGHSFLYLVPDAERVLGEVRRVLRPGRRCAFLEPAATPTWPLLPRAFVARALSEPRFVSSMALWRIVSRGYGRFDERRFRDTFERAGLRAVDVRPTLEGIGVFGVAERPPIRALRDVDWERWRPTDVATLLFVVRGGEILLIRKKRGLGAGKVNGPGGRIDPGETPRACAIREVEEELRVTPFGVEPMGELRFQFADGYGLHAHVFRASGCEGTPTETDEAVPLWTPTDRIPYSEMWADDAMWLPLLLEGRRFSGRFVFDGDLMRDFHLEHA